MPSQQISKEGLREFGLTKREQELVLSLWGGAKDYTLLNPKRTSEIVDGIHDKIPGAIIFRNAAGRPTERFGTFIHLDDTKFVESSGFDLKKLGITRVLHPQGRTVWEKLLEGPATFNELLSLLKSPSNPNPSEKGLRTVIERINLILKYHFGGKAIKTVQIAERNFLYYLVPEIRKQLDLPPAIIDPFSKLEPMHTQIFSLFDLKKRWKSGEIGPLVGLYPRSVNRTLAFLNKVAIAFDKPEPFILGGRGTPGKESWAELRDEFSQLKKIASTYALSSYFPASVIPVAEAIIRKPGILTDEIAGEVGLTSNETKDRIETIKSIIKRHNLPPLNTRDRRGHSFSTLFTEHFSMPAPRNELLPFLSDLHRKIYELKAYGRNIGQIARKLKIDRTKAADGVSRIRKYLKLTHYNKIGVSKALGIRLEEVEQLRKYVPIIRYDGKIWISKSVHYLSPEILESLRKPRLAEPTLPKEPNAGDVKDKNGVPKLPNGRANRNNGIPDILLHVGFTNYTPMKVQSADLSGFSKFDFEHGLRWLDKHLERTMARIHESGISEESRIKLKNIRNAKQIIEDHVRGES